MQVRGLLLRVKELRQSTSPAVRDLAAAIGKDPMFAAEASARELAEASKTSPSTVVRLCRKVGCEGYRDFQRELVYELAAMGDTDDVALEDIDPEDDASGIIDKILHSDVRSMEATARLLDADVLAACAEAIASARVVNLYGVGASLLVARDLEAKLDRVDKLCRVHDDWHAQLLSVRNLHADDLAIVFSYSGLTQEMLTVARRARDRGAKVIAVTRAVGSELADMADWVLGVASSEPLIRSGAMGSRMSQLLVVDALFAVYVTSNYEQCSKTMLHNFDEKRPGGTIHA